MQKVNEEFKRIGTKLMKEGISNKKDIGVRTKWEDGTTAYTKATFGTVTRYNLQEGFPISEARQQYWKSAIKEILWIWVKNSNKVSELGSKIWDQWTDEEGTIGKAYGYQLGRVHNFPEGEMTQVERLIYLLKNKPGDRRMVVTLWDKDDMKEMNLTPCLHTITFSVIGGKLNAILDQRSGDFLAASGPGGYNEIQYSALVHMLAQIADLEVGELVHTVANHHVYDRHETYLKELLEVDGFSKVPRLKINKNVKNFFDFKIEDFELENYEPKTKSKRIEIAI